MALLDKVHQLREIVHKHYLALAARVAGRDALSPEEQVSIAGMDFPEEPTAVLEEAYHFGHTEEEDQTRTEHHEERAVRQLSVAEEEALKIARHQAAEHIRAQGDRFVQQLGQIIYDGAHAERVQEEISLAVETSRAVGSVVSRLRQVTGDMSKDWDKVAVTELHNARQHAKLDKIRGQHGATARIYKQVAADACPYCVDLHIGPDGAPRIFKMSDLGLSNVGRSKAAWEAVVGSTHPNCQCEIFRLPDDWGFDEDGQPHPKGEFGSEFSKSSYDAEQTLRKNLRTKENVSYNGLSVAIEQRKGDVRKWTDKSGRQGQTVMNYAYGYVKGTEGADGDGYDCYVGPVPDAPFVYVVHQNKEDDDSFDEDKAMLGFSNPNHAKRAFLEHYDDPTFFGSMSVVPIEEFKQKMARMNERQPDCDGMLKAEPHNDACAPRTSVPKTHSETVPRTHSEPRSSTNGSTIPRLTVTLSKGQQTRYSGPTDNPTPPRYPAGPTLSPHQAAWTAQAGGRAVREGSSGPNILFNSPQPPNSGTNPNARRQQISDHVALRSEDYERRRAQRKRSIEGEVAEGIRSQGQISTHVQPLKPYKIWEERAQIDQEIRDTIPDKHEWTEQKLKERNENRRVTPYRTDETTARFYIRPHLLDRGDKQLRQDPPEIDMSSKPALPSDEGAHRVPKTDVGVKHQPRNDPPAEKEKPKKSKKIARNEEETKKSVTVQKRGVGEVTLDWSEGYAVSLPGESPLQFTSLSQACDYVWVLSKGYRSVENYRGATGRQKVPSGAGWKFWGLRGQP